MTLSVQSMFDYQTIAELAKVVEVTGEITAPIGRVGRSGHLTLSFAQQRLWLLAQLEGVSEAYHIPIGLRLRGVLDEAALKRALDRLVARHEALRTTFYALEGEPFQQIGPEDAGFCLWRDDLRGRSDAQYRLARHIRDEATASFDLERGPLIRGRLIRLADQEHVLLITLHHIVSDGWSMGILNREVSALYRAYLLGESDPLPVLPIQYADYAAWQREWLSGERLAKQSQYWQQTLKNAPAVLELPTDRQRPAVQTFTGGRVPVSLDETLTVQLKELSQRHGMTLFMTVLAGWALVLARLSGQEDLVVGTPSDNRGRQEIDGLIGFFVNTLALRIDLSGGPTAEQLLARVKRAVLEAQANRDLPFEQVVELVNPLRSSSYMPLFQVLFNWQHNHHGNLDLLGLTFGGTQVEHVSCRFDLELHLYEADGRIVGGLNYAEALFARETVERYAEQLPTVLLDFVG